MFVIRKYKFKGSRFKHSWQEPNGFDTGVKVYNNAKREKVPLITHHKGILTWYTCGPTVYDSAHIGHASCYVKLDIIQKVLKNHFKLNVISAMNITDIDDKIISRSNHLNIPWTDVSKYYTKEFWSDLNSLKVSKPNVVLTVSENIDNIKKFIENLIVNKSAYLAKDGSVYFRTRAYENYGKLQNIGHTDLNHSETNSFKEAPEDFALWKSSKKGEPFWNSSWGTGRPGWHIECSTLATKIFGSTIDVHAGGIDLRFPHHENEEAQSCSFHSCSQWVNYWLHTGHLHLKQDEKMSKSLKNTISIQDMLKSVSPDVFRLACLMSHYRSNMEYSPEFMQTASSLLSNYKNCIESCIGVFKGLIKPSLNNDILNNLLASSKDDLDEALKDDFNTPQVINLLNNITNTANSMFHSTASSSEFAWEPQYRILGLVNFVLYTLNLFDIDIVSEKNQISESVNAEIMDILNLFRQSVRRTAIGEKHAELLSLCDQVRNELGKSGIVIKDHGKVSTWLK